ncbi:MAG: hypothetical protein AB2A00_27360 [Myxococcota bacterium]
MKNPLPTPTRPPAAPSPERYEPPTIAWEEDFEPAGQSTGCLTGEGDCLDAPAT